MSGDLERREIFPPKDVLLSQSGGWSTRLLHNLEADSEDLVQAWIARWSDVIDFEVIPVVSPGGYWSRIGAAEGTA